MGGENRYVAGGAPTPWVDVLEGASGGRALPHDVYLPRRSGGVTRHDCEASGDVCRENGTQK